MTASAESHGPPERIALSRVLSPGLVVGFALIILILLGTLAIGVVNLRLVHQTSDAVAQTYSVKVALQHLLTTMLDAETGERGFIITGGSSHLESYNLARATISKDIARVRELATGNRDQQADLDRLAVAADLKLRELAEALRQRQESGFAASSAQVATNTDKRTMDEIRSIVGRMERRVDATLAARTAQARRSYRTALVIGWLTTGVGLFAVIALFIGTLRYGRMRLRATQAAEQQRAELREALNQKDDFVALVSHELRTPANSIAGWARILLLGATGDRPDKAIAAIARNAEALTQLIHDLMDTSQLISGRMRLAIAPVDVEAVIRDAIDAVRLSADNKGVALTEILEPGLAPINGDAGRLKQVVWNLLANAIKFTPKGGRVTVAAMSADSVVRVEVLDTGDGIDPAFLPHVFERYRQGAAATPGRRGLGLGLAIVRHIVELHGGTVSAQSAGPGRGSTFVVELPRAVRAEPVAMENRVEQL